MTVTKMLPEESSLFQLRVMGTRYTPPPIKYYEYTLRAHI